MNLFNREYDKTAHTSRDAFSDYYHAVAWLKRNIGNRQENDVVNNYTDRDELKRFVTLRQTYDGIRPAGPWLHSKFMDKLYYERGEGWVCFFATRYGKEQASDLLIVIEDDAQAVLFSLDSWHAPRDAAM